ncbi:NAD(P)/FAD-dependent oxidoreductase [Agromyces aerolatus]|uniref:NAD(P)/FAD-dependent oxidoreductase n=1 Tax=Agromyces sp. LY-1074 TaxID=3074080 RepID=UPI00285D1B8D|nr:MULTISPECIES: FAD-dependent oxidoreductase [unclassified Agromyces]MDR5699040.1 FAD-dependent oxidoreductase [Agromyces sp. LY-1074]MDR5705182.1 FAD-dependent oxidoreductase [Agromyces sp. LY-1358]
MKRTADVIVIGGGVLGAATLFELAARGLTAVLVERSLPGRQGSGTTAGNLHIQAVHSRRPNQQVPVNVARLLPFQREASTLWEGVGERLGADVGLVRSGGFTVAETAEDVEELHTKSLWESDAGIPTEVLDGTAARAAMPQLGPSVRGATWCALDGYANSLLATPAYLSAARTLGATVYTDAPVVAIERSGSSWTVRSTIGEFSAPAVVNAAGPWIQQVSAMAGYRLAMAPVAIQMHETVRAPRFLPHLVQHVSRGLSVKQVTTGNVLVGGGWPAGRLDLAGRTTISEESVAGNMADAIRIVPAVEKLTLSRAWPGPLAATPDEMPVIGEITGSDGFFVTGGTYAFTFSPVWARTMTELIIGEPPTIEVADLSPDRLLLDEAEPAAPRVPAPAPTLQKADH